VLQEERAWQVLIRRRRKTLGLTQRHVAELAGIAERTVIAIEQGRTSVSVAHLLDVLRVLGLHLRISRGRGGVIEADPDA
jgi:transcriptional regulator with XRE-family HTH domain